MSTIIARRPYAGASWVQRLTSRVYLGLAQIVGRAFGRSDDVVSVYIRRSLAAGEITFGLSDIDHSIVLRTPLDGDGESDRLADLCRISLGLRRALPVLGQGQVWTREELNWRGAVDPYRHSLCARSAILVYGEPVEMADFPVSAGSSVRRFIFWFEKYLPRAVRKANRRNLGKFALELWKAWSCATGLTTLPYVTRHETEAACRAQDGASLPANLGRDARQTAAVCFRLAARLHDVFMQPLATLAAPLVYRSVLWPLCEERTFVVLPDPDAAHPAEVARPDSLICTPVKGSSLLLTHVLRCYKNGLCPGRRE